MARISASSPSWMFASARNAIFGLLVRQAVLVFAPVLGGIGGMIAYLQGWPWVHIYVVALSTAAVASLMLNQGRAFFVANSPRDKFFIKSFQTSLRGDPVTGAPTGYSVAIVFKNVAPFTIEYEVEEIFLSLENVTIQDRKRQNAIHRVNPRDFAEHNYGTIPYVYSPPKSPLEGKLSIAFDYGKIGKPGFKETQKFNIFIYVDQFGNPLQINGYRTDLEPPK